MILPDDWGRILQNPPWVKLVYRLWFSVFFVFFILDFTGTWSSVWVFPAFALTSAVLAGACLVSLREIENRIDRELDEQKHDLFHRTRYAYVAESLSPEEIPTGAYGLLYLTSEALVFKKYANLATARIPVRSISSVTLKKGIFLIARGPWVKISYEDQGRDRWVSFAVAKADRWKVSLDRLIADLSSPSGSG